MRNRRSKCHEAYSYFGLFLKWIRANSLAGSEDESTEEGVAKKASAAEEEAPDGTPQYEVERILGAMRRGSQVWYLVKWKGCVFLNSHTLSYMNTFF